MDEEHEKKTGEIQRSTHDDDGSQDSKLDHIPVDLTLEVLSKHDATSLVRYNCVSKIWSYLTTLPSFINSFGSRVDKEQEEKTGEIKMATHDDDDERSQHFQLDYLPFDLTLEILSRLPAKSLVRYRCVSKNWSSLTTLPSFIDLFGSRSSARQPRLLLSFVLEERKRFVFSFPQHHNPDGSCPPLYSYQITDPCLNEKYKREHECFNRTSTISESVHGLILLNGNKIWNPSLRRFFTLPDPKDYVPGNVYMWYLGYDPLEDKHKVLSVLRDKHFEPPQVLTLGAQESWRITESYPMHYPSGGDGRCINGVVYYAASVVIGNKTFSKYLTSFDVKSEKFNPPVKFPKTCSWSGTMSSYDGKLALVNSTTPFGDVDLYILKDETGDEWTHKRYHVDCHSEWTSRMHFWGITDNDELIFAPTGWWYELFYILYFDPRRHITRPAWFDGGTMVKELRRSYILSKRRINSIGVFPNHIESLLSL
ncbi:unnamed protein product [Microthlaspi erraticum]|uniref:F-box domain-containing protein n=1 Tax=Microthlaspi erraticum TaxID=1685480 RepID=A0A6D2IHI9_9BRAS|nr:unnamed protein product [Microthlaspi erraticum]